MNAEETNLIPDKILCACGCGQFFKRFDPYGRERRFIYGHNLKNIPKASGIRNGNWGGGSFINGQGYRLVLKRDHLRVNKNGYVFEHILVMEAILGRPILKTEVVHHINGIKNDNRPENLELISSNSQHIAHHNLGNKRNFIDMSKRICCDCKRGVEEVGRLWFHIPKYNTKLRCYSCYRKWIYRLHCSTRRSKPL